MSATYVVYCRVSTTKQRKSGLGLDAQKNAAETHAKATGGTIARLFIEVESGKNNERAELGKALALCRRMKATLLVAKLDRLSRDAAFLLTLQGGAVPFVCCDNPHANPLTIGLLAVIAQHEREMISQRTKAALAAAKKRGVKLGSAREGHWDGREDRRQAGLRKATVAAAKIVRQEAIDAYCDLLPSIREQHTAGATLREIAARLNDEGQRTRGGKPFTAATIQRILRRGTVV